MAHADLRDAAYDQPAQDAGAERVIFLCTTPRTGSHRLARALYELGLGVPLEYFDRGTAELLAARWGVAGDRQSPGWFDRYWREVLRRRTRNGTAAVSLFGSQLAIARRLVATVDRPVLIHLHRRSMVDQIASLLAIYRTKRPYDSDLVIADIPDIGEISPRSIAILHRWLALQNRKWRDFLADRPHLSTASEDFFRDPGKVLRAILAQASIALAPAAVEAAASGVRASRAYSTNADIKRRLIEEHAASFAAIRQAEDPIAPARARPARRSN